MERWALILGASSGFGRATAIELSKREYNIAGVHLDRKQTMHLAEEVKREIEKNGRKALFFNVNAADARKREYVLSELERELKGDGKIHIFLHSLAFGALRPYIGEDNLTEKQMTSTLLVMAHTLVFWVQDIFKRGLFAEGARIFAMTSAGSHRVLPFYGAISAAKAALESHIRQLALELAPHGITVNAIRAGVTDTPALRKIPGYEEIMGYALRKNPHGRLTHPEDVARAIAALSSEDLYWMTGNVINVDGGEDIVG